MEFPAADAGLEDRAGARRRLHGGAEAGRVHAADGHPVRRDLRARRRAEGRRQHRAGRPGRGRGASSTIPASQKIAFTGSSEVGKIIRKATAGSGKKLSLELGGKSAFIVFEDADLDSAVEGLVDGIWFNQGQVCCAGSRLLVQEGIADAFIAKVKARMGKLRVGSPLDKNTDIGPLVDRTQLDRVRGLVAEGAKQGAECWQPDCALPATGYFHLPTLATGVAPANILAQEEVFGPVLATMTFRTTEEAIELANNTRYGLAASVWSENINLALHVAPQLKAGVVWINGTNMFDAACGFGGYRESGFGREGGTRGHVRISGAQAALGPAIKPAAEAAAAAARRQRRRRHRPHGKALHRRQAGAAGRQLFAAPSLDRQGQARRRGRARQPQGHPRRGLGRARLQGMAGRDRLQPRQVLYFLAENLSARADEFAARLADLTGVSAKAARAEVELSVERLFYYAGMADKFEGRVHQPPARAVTLALHEPVGVVGIVARRRRAAARPRSRWSRRRSPWATRSLPCPVAALSAGRDRSLPGDRKFRPAGRRDQHRHRQDRRTRRRAGQA